MKEYFKELEIRDSELTAKDQICNILDLYCSNI